MQQYDLLMAFEEGALSAHAIVVLFSDLVKTGLAWKLQGYYGRTAHDLIKSGYIDQQGNILKDIPEEV